MLQGGSEPRVMLLQGVFRVEENQLCQGSISAGRRKTVLVAHLDHFQVLLAIVATENKTPFIKVKVQTTLSFAGFSHPRWYDYLKSDGLIFSPFNIKMASLLDLGEIRHGFPHLGSHHFLYIQYVVWLLSH